MLAQRMCYSQYVHNFIMRMGTPLMQIFLTYSPYAYGESPYAYGDQSVTCQQSFLESRIEPVFVELVSPPSL